jgi:hypothetical protein
MTCVIEQIKQIKQRASNAVRRVVMLKSVSEEAARPKRFDDPLSILVVDLSRVEKATLPPA